MHKSNENTEKLWNLIFQKMHNSHAYCAEILRRLCEVCVENGLNFATTTDSSIMTTLQFIGCHQSFYGGRGGPTVELKHPPLFTNFAPSDFLALSQIKIHL
jgi:hypothetical protein